MKMPEQTKPALWGAVGGAIAVGIVGFTLGGWVTGGGAAAMAKDSAERAVVVALAGICVIQFQGGPDAAVKLVELKALSPYQQAMFLEEGGWATMPGGQKPATGVGRDCATTLNAT